MAIHITWWIVAITALHQSLARALSESTVSLKPRNVSFQNRSEICGSGRFFTSTDKCILNGSMVVAGWDALLVLWEYDGDASMVANAISGKSKSDENITFFVIVCLQTVTDRSLL
jgi:hypothetical protein